MGRKIKFPRLERIYIQGYAMYPGPNNQGLDWTFKSGVTVAVGINGLGKTTFLNTLLYALTGQMLLPKAEQIRLGAGRYKLMQPSRITYFTERVNDAAKDAKLELWFELGGKDVYVKRNLANLRIEALTVGKTHIVEPSEERYLEAMADLAGLQDDYQFHIVTKYLLFFLEGYIPLLWDRESQFEMLRILFIDEGIARRLADLKREIMQKDSRFRNMRAVINALTEKHGVVPEDDLEGDELKDLEAQLRLLEQQEKGVGEKVADLETERLLQLEKVQALQERRYRIEVEIAEFEQEVRAMHDVYLRSITPAMGDTARLLLAQLLEGAGCAVCGSRDETTRLRVQQDLAADRCPVCHSPKSAQEQKPATPIKAPALKKHLEKLAEKREVAANLAIQIRGETEIYEQLQRNIREAVEQQREAAAQVERTRAQLPPQDEAGRLVRRQILEGRVVIDNLKRELAQLHRSYTKLLEQANEELARITSQIRSVFSQYARHFLEETVGLEYEKVRVSLGQEHKVWLPSFTVKMTSGTEIKTPLPRKDENAVSESQREFLELAFRMALITVASSGKHRGLLVMETPEASLDAIFIRRAGQMLRDFAGMKSRRGGAQVIASSNISGAHMIQALLGIDGVASARDKRAREERVINMLKVTAPNAAYRKHKQEYDKLYREATGL